MRYGIFSDVHSNLEALEAVLREIEKDGVDRLLCAGDLVGYGPDPGPCLERLRRGNVSSVAGNHDWAVAGKLDLDWFNPPTRAALEWTAARLCDEEKRYLQGLPLLWRDETLTMAHGGLEEPEGFPYTLDPEAARRSMRLQETPVAFIGHTHVPGVYVEEMGGVAFRRPSGRFRLDPQARYLVNVGAVGQPRDGDPRSAYCLFDTDERTVEIRRVAYPVTATQEKMRRAGLPASLIERLSAGF